ncbi:MAG: peptidoglycan-binding protein [Lachnospiraceae bacterium]|nr:peptidoglycan-binding protein [Lachnospiraceae bacterium]
MTTSRVGSCTVTLGQYIQGNVDPEIKTIQIILNAKGYKGKDGKALAVDGELGDNTAYAIEQLQRKAGMKNINFGTVSTKTWEILIS